MKTIILHLTINHLHLATNKFNSATNNCNIGIRVGVIVFNATFNNILVFSYIVVVTFIGARKPEYQEKPTNLS